MSAVVVFAFIVGCFGGFVVGCIAGLMGFPSMAMRSTADCRCGLVVRLVRRLNAVNSASTMRAWASARRFTFSRSVIAISFGPPPGLRANAPAEPHPSAGAELCTSRFSQLHPGGGFA